MSTRNYCSQGAPFFTSSLALSCSAVGSFVPPLPSPPPASPLLQSPSLSLSLSLMAALVLLVLLSVFIRGSEATWCVCRSDASAAALQKTLDYACGAGADCTPVLQNGACYSPNTVLAHCSYAANSFFQRKGQAAGSCDFSGTATVTTTDPSYTGCSYPSTASTAGTSTTTPTFGTPGMTPPGTPSTFTPGSNGVLGGLGPSGNSMSTDGSAATAPLVGTWVVFLSLAITMLSGLVLLRLDW